MRACLSLFIIALAFGGQAAFAQDAGEAIDQTGLAWEAAFNAGDAKAVADLYTEDGALYPPGGEAISGRQAIQAFWQQEIDRGVQDGPHQRIELVESGNLAYEIGRLVLRMPSHAGLIDVGGSYLVIWQRGDDGIWRMHRDIWNLAAPDQP